MIIEPKKWREMTPEEKGALLLAHHEGKVIEYYCDVWKACASNNPVWANNDAYRVKPEPVVETMSLYRCGITYKITCTVIDGEIDCASVRMEKIND